MLKLWRRLKCMMNKHNYEPVSLTKEGIAKTYKMQCTCCNDFYWLTMPNISVELEED